MAQRLSQKASEPGLPAEAAGEFGPDLVLPQEVEQRQAFLLGPALDAGGVGDRRVERLAAGLGMGAHDRMLGLSDLRRRCRAACFIGSSRVLVTSALAES